MASTKTKTAGRKPKARKPTGTTAVAGEVWIDCPHCNHTGSVPRPATGPELEAMPPAAPVTDTGPWRPTAEQVAEFEAAVANAPARGPWADRDEIEPPAAAAPSGDGPDEIFARIAAMPPAEQVATLGPMLKDSELHDAAAAAIRDCISKLRAAGKSSTVIGVFLLEAARLVLDGAAQPHMTDHILVAAKDAGVGYPAIGAALDLGGRLRSPAGRSTGTPATKARIRMAKARGTIASEASGLEPGGDPAQTEIVLHAHLRVMDALARAQARASRAETAPVTREVTVSD